MRSLTTSGVVRAARRALLFVRNPGGISHNPDESVVPEDIPNVLDELGEFVLRPAEEGSYGV